MIESNIQLRRILASEAVDRLAAASSAIPSPPRNRLRFRPGRRERSRAVCGQIVTYSQVSSRRGA
jgi:hypothetical protein